MKKQFAGLLMPRNCLYEKLLRIMKLTTVLLLAFCMHLHARVFSQKNTLSLQAKASPVSRVLADIQQKTGYSFFYRNDQVNLQRRVTLDFSNAPIEKVLTALFDNEPIRYQFIGDVIVLRTEPLVKTEAGKAYLTVTGKITNAATHEPLAGVTVIEKASGNGTATDKNGDFKLEVADDQAVLVVRSIGFQPVELPLAGKHAVEIALVEEKKVLDQVVVVGYGTQKKKDITGAVAVIGSKELEDRPNNQFGYAIEGKAAGVQVIRPSGQPQAGFSIRVRGTSTITSGSEPLYIVDGVPTENTQEINPADIENLTVLKDASAAAIYGSSGANGVVLITTKRGHNQPTRVALNAYTGYSSPWRKLDVLNAAQYKDLMTEMGLNTDWASYPNNNYWQDQVFRTANAQNYQVSLTGGNEKTGYYMSGSWMKQDGIVLTNTVRRANFKLNLDHSINKIFKVGTSIAYSRWKDVDVDEAGRFGAVMSSLSGSPVTGVYDNEGHFAIDPFISDVENPVGLLLKNDHKWINYRFNGNVYAEAQVLPSLKLRTMFGLEHTDGTYNGWVDPFRSREGRGFKGIADLSNSNYDYWISENTVTYTLNRNAHQLTAVGGFVASERSVAASSIHATGFGSAAIPSVNAGSIKTSTANTSRRRNSSFIGRLNYAYDDRYLATANFRADASTVFANTDNPWGYFPSFSLGWRISKEKFFTLDKVNELKLRLGWGAVGNDQTADYASYGLVSPTAPYVIGGVVVPGTAPGSMENVNLRWETTRQSNIGLDIALFNNRVLVTTDYYIKRTEDMLLDRPVPASLGIPSNTAIKNIGRMENKGFEFAVSTRNLAGAFKWNTDFNISFNRSKVLALDGGLIKIGNIADRGTVAIAEEGKPLGLFYGLVAKGVDPQTGDMIYEDLDKDGELSDGDYTIIGNSNPKYMFGLTNNFSYGNWSLNIFIQGVQGNDIFNATRIELEGLMSPRNQLSTVLNRWTAAGQQTSIPRATYGDNYNSLISSRFIENGSYVRVKSVMLGYDLPAALLQRIKMNKVRLYVSAENLLTFTKYKGFDPEVSVYGRSGDNKERNIGQGVDYGTYPQSRDFIFGLNISF